MTITLHTIPLIEPTAENLAPFARWVGQPTTSPTLARGDIDCHHNICDANDFNEHPVASYLICYPRPLLMEQIERHRLMEEAFIPLKGDSVMVLGAPGELDPQKLVAVHMDGSFGLILYRDTWHFAPFALGQPATYMLLSGKDSGPDIEVVDLGPYPISQPEYQERK